MTLPLRSNSLSESSSLHYEQLRPCAAHRYSQPRGCSACAFSLSIATTGSHVPYKSLIHVHAAFIPDADWSVKRFPPALSREPLTPPVLTSPIDNFRYVVGRFAYARLRVSHLPQSCSGFSSTLTTKALYLRSLRRFDFDASTSIRGAFPHLSYSFGRFFSEAPFVAH